MYEVALTKYPHDPTMTSITGQALVVTAQISKVINYYEEAVKSDDSFNILFDLPSIQQSGSSCTDPGKPDGRH